MGLPALAIAGVSPLFFSDPSGSPEPCPAEKPRRPTLSFLFNGLVRGRQGFDTQTMKRKKTAYYSPKSDELKINYHGILCSSSEDPGWNEPMAPGLGDPLETELRDLFEGIK